MKRNAIYRGHKYNVVNEDDSFVTLEGFGYKKRIHKEEVLFEEEPVEDLLDQIPDKEIITDTPEDTLPNEYPDKSLKFDEEDIATLPPQIASKIADNQKKVADRQTQIASLQSEVAKLRELMQTLRDQGSRRLEESVLDETYEFDDDDEITIEGPVSGLYDELNEAEYQGRKVTLNKPMRGDVKKFKVYVKDPKTGNVKKVNFGDPDMRIRKSNPEARKSFRARHKCDQQKDKTSAAYWSCKMWESDMRTTMDADQWDKYKEQGVDVDPESHSETQGKNDEIMAGALQGLRRSFRQMLNELDDILETEEDYDVIDENAIDNDEELNGHIHIDPDRETDDINYRSTDNYYDNLEDEDIDMDPMNEEGSNSPAVDNFNTQMNKLSPNYYVNNPDNIVEDIKAGYVYGFTGPSGLGGGEGPPEEVMFIVNPETGDILEVKYNEHYDNLKEDAGAGTAAVAGPGCADGTVNQAVNAMQGIAQVPSRMGIGMHRRKEPIAESIKKLFNVELDESKLLLERHVPNLNRHIIADKIEEQIDPLTESECSNAQRRKIRMESIGKYATLRECARFIAENKFSCNEGSYVPREEPQDPELVLEMMKKANARLMNKIKRA